MKLLTEEVNLSFPGLEEEPSEARLQRIFGANRDLKLDPLARKKIHALMMVQVAGKQIHRNFDEDTDASVLPSSKEPGFSMGDIKKAMDEFFESRHLRQ